MTDGEIAFSRPDITDAEIRAVECVLRSEWLTTGSVNLDLEAALADYLGIPHVVAVSSCTAALEIAVAYLGLPRGARVGVPTWTFVSTALAAYHRGLTPVLLDIDPETMNLWVDALDRALDDADSRDAVIGVHFGGTALSSEIHERCSLAGVPLIEDAAHALGARDHRGMVAGQGTAGCCYSFYATKNLTSAEGGALATDDASLAQFAQSFRLHGLSRDAWARYHPGARSSDYEVVGDGLKANLPDVLAAIAVTQLQRFPAMQQRRREIVDRYRARLAEIDGLELVPRAPDTTSADHLMMVLLPPGTDRDRLRAQLTGDGIGTSVHFRPIHTFEWAREQQLPTGPGGVPIADELRYRALSLPLHTLLTDDEVDRVCDRLAGLLD